MGHNVDLGRRVKLIQGVRRIGRAALGAGRGRQRKTELTVAPTWRVTAERGWPDFNN